MTRKREEGRVAGSIRRIGWALLLFLPLAAACGGEPATESSSPETSTPRSGTAVATAAHHAGGTVTPAADSEASSADTAGLLAEVWGHLEASGALAAEGDLTTAQVHAAHPLAEYWSQIETPLAEHGLADEARQAFETYSQALQTNDADWRDAQQAAIASTRQAMETIAGDSWQEPAFQGQIIYNVLDGIKTEYGEAVENGQVVNTVEYQDAWGFFQVVQALYDPIADDVEAASADAARTIEDEIAALQGYFTAVTPPSTPATGEDVRQSVDAAQAALVEALGVEVTEPVDAAAQVERIEGMIQDAIAAYRDGDSERAYDLAANAYLDGFELMEGDLLEANQRELVEDLELDFKALRDGISNGQPVEEIESIAQEIDQGLSQALEVLQ